MKVVEKTFADMFTSVPFAQGEGNRSGAEKVSHNII